MRKTECRKETDYKNRQCHVYGQCSEDAVKILLHEVTLFGLKILSGKNPHKRLSA
jgi:hypothetical protein